ncbi:50S ribosomal protein L4 [Candidatus Parcubacteria bacterium]|nr:50S ribosomal protein L4 [Candidatus Parcubacteria bacterium]
MPSVDTYTAAGAKSTAKISLDKNIFGLEVKSHGLLKSAYTAYSANGRANLAKTKTRGEVTGSTKKPWRQKGTGRARFGSRYNPIWRGGGIAFGPTGRENYSKKINVTSKRLAICQALSLGAKSGKIKVIDDFTVKDGKTKSAVKLLQKLGANRQILIVLENKTEAEVRATANLADVKLIQANYLNAYDILNADTILLSKNVLDGLKNWLLTDSKTSQPRKVNNA